MKYWFRHEVDAGEGRTIQGLLDQFGHAGPFVYWRLTELCAQKWWHESDKNPEVFAGKFHFHARVLYQNFRVTPARLRAILGADAMNGQLRATFVGSTVEIDFPKLLELLDPKSKSVRKKFHDSSQEIHDKTGQDIIQKNSKKGEGGGPDTAELASKILDAVAKFTAGDPGIYDAVGPDWHWVSRTPGLVTKIRNMPRNQWTRRNTARELDAAWSAWCERLEAEKAQAAMPSNDEAINFFDLLDEKSQEATA